MSRVQRGRLPAVGWCIDIETTESVRDDRGGGPRSKGDKLRPSTALLLIGLLTAVIVGVAGWWAFGVALGHGGATAREQPERQSTAEVVDGAVGRTVTLAVTVRQPLVTVAANHLSGVVTSVGGGRVEQGTVLFEVAAVPVVAAESERPFYREMSVGMRGADVFALQRMLAAGGFLEGEPDSTFGAATRAAVMEWQASLGQQRTGVVALGTLAAIPRLPSTVAMDDAISLGALLSGGEPAVRAPSGDRTFVLVLSESQRSLVPSGAQVRVPFEDYSWDAVVSETVLDAETGNLELVLTAADGGSVCADECEVLPADESLSLLSEVQVVPAVSGPAVPSAAVHTRPDGTAYVVLEDGDSVPVDVLATGQGIAIVDGAPVGEHVRLSEQGEPSNIEPSPKPTER